MEDNQAEADDEDEDVGPKPAPGPSAKPASDADDSDEDDDDDTGADDLEDESTFPITHEITLKDHTKVSFATTSLSCTRIY